MKLLFCITVLIGVTLANPIKDEVSVCPRIISRSEWGASPPKGTALQELPVPYVVIHHTVMGEGECNTFEECVKVMKNIQTLHQVINGWDDIGYSFLVGGDGSVFEGRGWNKVGAHAPGYNDKSIGISVIGDFTDHLPNSLQLTATHALIACGLNQIENNYIQRNYTLYGHRETECPGNMFFEEIKSWPQFHFELEQNKTLS